MLVLARQYRRGRRPGTFLFKGKARGEIWEIGVAPEHDRRRLVAVTVFVKTGPLWIRSSPS